MAPAFQEDGGQPAGPSSFVNRVRANFEKLTKTRMSKHRHGQDEWRNGTTGSSTNPSAPGPTLSLEPPQATRPLNIPLPRLHRLLIPPKKRWSGSSAETWLNIDEGCGSSPTILVGSPDSWSWKSDSEWSLLPSPNEDPQPLTSLQPRESYEGHEVGQDVEICDHRGSGSNHPDIASLDTPPPQHSSSVSSPLDLLHRPRSLHHALAQRAWSSRLPQDIWYLVAERLGQHDLAQLSAVCHDTRYVADRFLHCNPTIRNARGMARWVAALEAQPKRRRLVRSLTIGWDAVGLIEGDADEAYVQMARIMRGSRRLKTMNLFADAPEGRFATKRSLPPSARTLNASGAVFLNLHQPLPPLLHLSVNVSIKDLKKTLGAVGCFGETLLQLRLFVKWETPFVKTEDNPARWCKPLKTARLVYFELREERSEKNVPLRIASGRWDKVSIGSTWPAVLAERVPSLRYLVWQPLWGENAADVLPGGGFYDVVRGYRENLFALLKLGVLAFALPDGRYSCHEPGKEDPREGRPVAGPEDLWRSMRRGDRGVQLL